MNALICIFIITYGIYALFYNFKFWLIYIFLIVSYHYLTQVKFFQTIYKSTRRRMIIATWGQINDPQIYSKVTLDITKIEPYLLQKSKEIGEKITLTIFTIKLMALVLKKYPELYGYIKFGKYVDKDSVDICCLVAVGEGEDLVNTTVKNADSKDFKEICEDLHQGVENIRAKKNHEHNKKMGIISFLPTFLIGPIMQITSYLSSIGISVDFLGIKKYEFGSCVLTSIGSLGIEDGYPPIPPLSFAPILITVCKKKVKNYYDSNHEINERSTMALNFTIDNRFIDARIAQGLNDDIKRIGENPEVFESEMLKSRSEIFSKDKKYD